MSSQPYQPLPHAPKGTTVESLLKPATTDPGGHVHLGKLTFDSTVEFSAFKRYQEQGVPRWGVSERVQVDTLYAAIHGTIPDQHVRAAPAGTTVEKLLTPFSSKADAEGFIHFGSLRVHQSVATQFRAAEKYLAQHDSEAFSTLYHLEHSDSPKTIRPVDGGKYQINGTVYWDPNRMLVDGATRSPPAVGLLHEETHALAPQVGAVLGTIPTPGYQNLEEQRVIQYAEAKMLTAIGQTPRTDHRGTPRWTGSVQSVQPAAKDHVQVVHETIGGKEHVLAPGIPRIGRVVGIDEAKGTMSVDLPRIGVATYSLAELSRAATLGDAVPALKQMAHDRAMIELNVSPGGEPSIRSYESANALAPRTFEAERSR